MESFIATVDERFNPARPERSAFFKDFRRSYDGHGQSPVSAYIYTSLNRGAPGDHLRVVLSAGALSDEKVGTVSVLRSDFSRRRLGDYRLVGIKHYHNGKAIGMIPNKALPLAVFK